MRFSQLSTGGESPDKFVGALPQPGQSFWKRSLDRAALLSNPEALVATSENDLLQMLREKFPAKAHPFQRVFYRGGNRTQDPGWVVLEQACIDATITSIEEILALAERLEDGVAIFEKSLPSTSPEALKVALDSDFTLEYDRCFNAGMQLCWLYYRPGAAQRERERQQLAEDRRIKRSEFANKHAVYSWEIETCSYEVKSLLGKKYPKLKGCLVEKTSKRAAYRAADLFIDLLKLYKWLKPKTWRKEILKDCPHVLKVTERLKSRKTGAWARKRLGRCIDIDKLVKALPPLPRKKKTRRKKS